MQIKIITVHSQGGEEQNESLNKFLRGNKIISIDKNFYSDSGGSYWSFCITYLLQSSAFQGFSQDRKDKIDYKSILSEEQFARFSSLRLLRKKIAEEDAVPAYAVFTDAELSEISKIDKVSLDELKKIEGIGEKRVTKYGEKIVSLFNSSE